MKDFSLLISVYLHEKAEYLEACFESIFQQSVLPKEIILVEDGPLTQELYHAIECEEKRFPSLKRIVLEKNQGLGIALNKGLQACSYDIIARMDTDDICLPDRFKLQLEYLIDHPETDVISAWIAEFDYTPNNIVGFRTLPERHEDIYRFGKKRNPINHPVVMFRKKAVTEVGGYLPCPYFEDYYLWCRMLKRGCHFYNIQQPLLLFRRSPEMIQRRGGFEYTHHEISFFKELHHIGFLSKYELCRNIGQRYLIRIIPNSIRSYIYKHILRTIP